MHQLIFNAFVFLFIAISSFAQHTVSSTGLICKLDSTHTVGEAVTVFFHVTSHDCVAGELTVIDSNGLLVDVNFSIPMLGLSLSAAGSKEIQPLNSGEYGVSQEHFGLLIKTHEADSKLWMPSMLINKRDRVVLSFVFEQAEELVYNFLPVE